MRKITSSIVGKINTAKSGDNYQLSERDRVAGYSDGKKTVYLWGHAIFTKTSDAYYLTDAGWNTATTAERLNGIIQGLGLNYLGFGIKYTTSNGGFFFLDGDKKQKIAIQNNELKILFSDIR